MRSKTLRNNLKKIKRESSSAKAADTDKSKVILLEKENKAKSAQTKLDPSRSFPFFVC